MGSKSEHTMNTIMTQDERQNAAQKAGRCMCAVCRTPEATQGARLSSCAPQLLVTEHDLGQVVHPQRIGCRMEALPVVLGLLPHATVCVSLHRCHCLSKNTQG